MRNFRTLLLLLCSFVSAFVSAQGVQTFTLVPATGFTGTPYQVKYVRDVSTYPLTADGLTSAKKALVEGKFNLTVVSSGTYSGSTYTPNRFYGSCVIPTGTKPGVSPPSSCTYTTTSVVTPPTTTTTVITIPAVNKSFNASDGSGTGSDIGGGYYGPYGDNTQYRQFSYTAPVMASDYNLSIHYKTNTQTTGKGNIVINGSQNIEFDLEGAEGGTRTTNRTISLQNGANTIRLEGKSGTPYFFDNIGLTRASSTSIVTSTGGTTTTPVTVARSYANVIVAGNSITDYGSGKGYDASAPENDYLHIVTARLQSLNANVKVRTFKDFQGGVLTDGPYWEEKHGNTDGGLDRFNSAADSQPDLLLVSLGENVKYANNYGQDLIDLVAKLTSKSPNCVVVIRTTIWGKTDIDNIIQQTAALKGWIFVDARNMVGAKAGLDSHPNDTGMLNLANLFWSAIPKTTTTTPPTTGTTTQPSSGSVDSQGFLVYADQGWSGADEKVIRGNGMQMRFKLSVGACPTWLSLDSDNENVIDDAQVGPQGAKFSDKGVQVQLSWYSNPAGGQPYTTDGRTIGGTGANPVQGGNTNPYFVASPVEKSAIINDPVRGQVFCSRTRSLLWDWPNTPGHGTVDLEYWTQPNKVVAYKARVNVEERPSGTPEQRKWTALSQEFLCFYGIADLNDHFVDINGSEYNMRSGVGLDRQSNDFFTSGCYIGIYKANRTSGLLYYTPRNAIFKSWQKTSESGKWADDASAYVNASSKWNMDIVGHYVDNGYFILGSKAEAMAAKAQLEPIDQSFDFDFTNTNNTWWNEDARLMRESNGLLKWYVGDPNHDVSTINTGKMLSPVRAWQASGFQNIEFTMAVSGTTQLNLKWGKPGQFGQVEFRTPITVTGDGTERTYQFNLSNLQNWNGTISYIGLEANLNTNNPNAYILLRRARKF